MKYLKNKNRITGEWCFLGSQTPLLLRGAKRSDIRRWEAERGGTYAELEPILNKLTWGARQSILLQQEEVNRPGEPSLSSSQANELKNTNDFSKWTFQMDGLPERRDVAYRVLRTVGWQSSCTYTDTISPKTDGTTKIQWSKITAGPTANDPAGSTDEEQRLRHKVTIFEIQCVAQVANGIAVAIIVSWRNGVRSDGRIVVMGRTLTEPPCCTRGNDSPTRAPAGSNSDT